ncbi:MAG: hypothetical protein GY839_18480 [candidate division Zixibacteria bacterium]|nr:hypothetical protein [candidate division Zixibacteria bacterium]
MRCREAKRRLNSAGEHDVELIEHLNNCLSCAREAQMMAVLDSVLTSSRERADYPETPFSDIRGKVISRSAGEIDKEKSLMSKIKAEITSHPRFSFGMALTVLVFAFILLVPFSYNKTVGYNLEISSVKADDSLKPESLSQVIAKLGYKDSGRVMLIAEPDNKRLILTNIPTEQAARDVVIAVETTNGQDYAFSITPVVEKVANNLYTRVKDGIVTFKIEGEGKSDDEIGEEIWTVLKQEGINTSVVAVRTDPNGTRDIFIDINDSTDNQMSQSQLEFVTESGDILFSLGESEKVNLNIETEGKTVEEIEAEIREQLKEKNLGNTIIEVIENPDGKHEIILKIDKD